jgi:nucleoside-diphosphate-sugar epimerase
MMRESWDFQTSMGVVWQYRKGLDNRQLRAHESAISFEPISYTSSIVRTLGKIDAVICLAGVSSGTQAELSLNVQLAEASLGLAEDLGASRLFYCSSAAVYGRGENLTERNAPGPTTDYGQSKLDAERVLSGSKSRVSIISMRMANALFADSITGQLRLPSKDNSINLDFFPDGKSLRRSYIDACSLGHIIDSLSVIRMPKFSVLNIASVEAIQMNDLLNKLGVPWVANQRSYWSGQNITLSTKLLRGMLSNSNLHFCWAKSISDWGDIS